MKRPLQVLSWEILPVPKKRLEILFTMLIHLLMQQKILPVPKKCLEILFTLLIHPLMKLLN
jgi:hypothetical protein